jgi:NRPS condensation-like uncharacterized protein
VTGRNGGRRRSQPPSGGRQPFTIIDEVECYFDTADEPANVPLEVRLPFHLDQAAFRAAVLAAVTASPRASARRVRPGLLSRSYCWERPAQFDADPVSCAAFADERELAALRDAFTAQSPPLGQSPLVRLLLASGPEGDCVILNGHHAAMDGTSWLELLRDIGRRYAGGQPLTPATPPGRPRPETPRPAADPLPTAADRSRPAARGWRARLPARIAADGGGQRGVGIHLTLLPGVPRVPDVGGSADRPTLNDALVAALIVTVGRWNASRGKPVRPVRVSVPVNARAPGEQAAGNLSRLARVSAIPPVAGNSAAALLLDVAGQTRQARMPADTRHRPEFRAVAGLSCPAVVKGWLVRAAMRTAGPAFCDTVMLTNLGRVDDPPAFGGSEQVTMAFSGTAQMPRGLSVAAITAGGQLQISVRYNRRLVSAAAACRFAAEFGAALGELTVAADSGQPAGRAPDPDDRQPGRDRHRAEDPRTAAHPRTPGRR